MSYEALLSRLKAPAEKKILVAKCPKCGQMRSSFVVSQASGCQCYKCWDVEKRV